MFYAELTKIIPSYQQILPGILIVFRKKIFMPSGKGYTSRKDNPCTKIFPSFTLELLLGKEFAPRGSKLFSSRVAPHFPMMLLAV